MSEIKVSLKDLVEQQHATIVALEARIAALEARNEPKAASSREMSDDDARRVVYGDLAEKSHKSAASELGLSYGQIYSARLEFTFKAVHKAAHEAGQKNRWAK